jgi:hypothetical protein
MARSPLSNTHCTTTIKVIFHEKHRQRETWAPHGVNRFYLASAMVHYRCHSVYCSTTGQDRIVDTVKFMPQHCKVPGLSSADAVTVAATYLTHALRNPPPAAPFKQPGT